MAKPLICYKSILPDATVSLTGTGTASGYALANIQDYKSYTLWKSDQVAAVVNIDIDLGVGNTADADYIAIVNHNLNTLAASVKVMGDAGTPASVERLAAVVPGEDGVTVKTWTAPGAFRYWRVQITDSVALPFDAAPFAAVILLGLKTELPEYLAPGFAPFNRGVELSGTRSRGGHFLAGITRGLTHRDTISLGAAGAARADWTSDLTPFLNNHALLGKPFCFTLDTADGDFDDARYLKVPDDSDPRALAVGDAWVRLRFDLPVEEAFMEPAE
jgi:hypothetical protein